jgi:uncharacterized protein YecE (DUF72 family)
MNAKVKWLVGCSGFSYKDWRPIFYPTGLGPAKWLKYYSGHFNTMESNVTFYRTPQPKTFQKWFSDTPDDFYFSVKAPRTITHFKRMVGVKERLTAFYDLIQNSFQHKLGAILFQFPPGYSYTKERLDNILEQLDHSFDNVVEFRHISWWQDEVWAAFREKGITFCSISHPTLPDQVIHTADTIYFRFHGVPHLYKSSYTHEYLDNIITQIQQFNTVRTVYLYFNNTIAGTAIENVRYVKEKCQCF